MRSAYRHKKYVETAIKGIEQAIEEADAEEGGAAEPVWDKKKVQRIADLYRKLNLHPLALGLIARMENETKEELSTEKKEILTEWEGIVKQHVQIYRAVCHLLGQKVSDVADWSQVHVLRPSDTFWKPRDLSE